MSAPVDPGKVAALIHGAPRPAPRTCPGCGQTDTDPHHVTAALVDAAPPPTWHHDCHAAVGCRYCIAVVRQAGGVTGDAMLAHKIAMQSEDAPWLVIDGPHGPVAHHAHHAPTTPHPFAEKG